MAHCSLVPTLPARSPRPYLHNCPNWAGAHSSPGTELGISLWRTSGCWWKPAKVPLNVSPTLWHINLPQTLAFPTNMYSECTALISQVVNKDTELCCPTTDPQVTPDNQEQLDFAPCTQKSAQSETLLIIHIHPVRISAICLQESAAKPCCKGQQHPQLLPRPMTTGSQVNQVSFPAGPYLSSTLQFM